MRKILMRICRGVLVPGGPWALESNTATEGVSKVTDAATTPGFAKLSNRLEDSAALSEMSLGVDLECTAQCGQNSDGWSRLTALGSGFKIGSSNESTVPIAIAEISWWAISGSATVV